MSGLRSAALRRAGPAPSSGRFARRGEQCSQAPDAGAGLGGRGGGVRPEGAADLLGVAPGEPGVGEEEEEEERGGRVDGGLRHVAADFAGGGEESGGGAGRAWRFRREGERRGLIERGEGGKGAG